MDHAYADRAQTHLLWAFVANLKIDAIYALYLESFCEPNLAIRKVFAFSDSEVLIGCPIQFLPPLNISNKYLTLKSNVLVDNFQSTNHLPSHKSLSVIHCFHPPCILELRTGLIQWQTDFRGISYFILGHLDTNGQPDKFIGRSMHFEFNL